MSVGTILKTGLKYARVLPRYAFGNGYGVISNARKTSATGYTIFQNHVTKSKAGWKALVQDIQTTASRPSKIASAWKNGVLSEAKAVLRNGGNVSCLTKLKGGLKGLASSTSGAIKSAYRTGVFSQMRKVLTNGGKVTTATKVWGGMKGVLKPLCKMPVLASIVTLAFEAPDIYRAFTDKDGGFVEGMKQLGKSGAKIAIGTAVGALGTVVAGPVGGIIGYGAGEYLSSLIFGNSYSETHPAQAEGDKSEEQAELNGTMPDEADTQAQRDALRSENESASETETETETESAQSSESSATTTQQTTQDNTGLPDKLLPPDPSTMISNPVAYTPNPFGFDGYTNIFQRFPMGYSAQYLGNGMNGLMV